MPDRSSFEYAIVRIVPQIEREEFINAGVILRCRERRFLGLRRGGRDTAVGTRAEPGPDDGAG